MGMKTILALMEKHDGMQSMLETALLLALGDIVVAFPVEHYGREIAAEAQRARRTFEAFMQKNDVPRSTTRTTSLSFGWLSAPQGETFVGNYGRAFDVIVMNRPDILLSQQRPSAVLLSKPVPEKMSVE